MTQSGGLRGLRGNLGGLGGTGGAARGTAAASVWRREGSGRVRRREEPREEPSPRVAPRETGRVWRAGGLTQELRGGLARSPGGIRGAA